MNTIRMPGCPTYSSPRHEAVPDAGDNYHSWKRSLLARQAVTAGSVRTRRSGELGVKGGTVRESTDSTWKTLEAFLGFES